VNPLNRRRRIDLLGAPLDLGGARRGCDMGPSAFRIAGLVEQLAELGYEVHDHGDVAVDFRESVEPGSVNAHYLTQITATCDELREQVMRSVEGGCLPLVIGGDHSIAIGTVSGVAQAYAERNEKIGLIWIDAHADMNRPETSPSGNVHGMPLQVLLGGGPEALTGLGGFSPKVQPENVVLIGIRDLDDNERKLVAQSGVVAFTMKEIDRMGMSKVADRALEVATQGTAGVHVSLDLDALDPRVAPGVGTPVQGGLTFRETHLLLELIADTRKLRSMEVVEHNPILDDRNKTAEIGVQLVQSALGRQIL